MTRPTPGAWLLLGTAVLQIVSVPLAGFDQADVDDPAAVPPGPFFAIWGLVVLGCLASAVWGLAGPRARRSPWRQVQLPLSLTQVLFALWLLAAATAEVLTLPVFLLMLALLLHALREVLRTAPGGAARYLLGSTLGLYAGWTSAAVWINATTVLPLDELAPDRSLQVQALAVAGAAVTVCALTVVLRAWPPYVLAGAWALTGVVVSGWAADEPLLWRTAAAGLLAAGIASGVGVARLVRATTTTTGGAGAHDRFPPRGASHQLRSAGSSEQVPGP